MSYTRYIWCFESNIVAPGDTGVRIPAGLDSASSGQRKSGEIPRYAVTVMPLL